MKTNIETKGLYARTAALLGIAAAAFLPVTSAYAQAAPEIQLIYYLNSTRLDIYGVNFGSTAGTLAIGGTAFPVIAWSPTQVQVSICPDGSGGSYCLGPSASYSVTMTTSTGHVAKTMLATVDTKLAAAMTDGSVTVTNVKINGGTGTAHVAPGATFKITADYNIFDNGCPTCIDAVVVGLQTSATPSCFYHGIEGPAPGLTAAGSATLTAPTGNGIYNIVAKFGQNGCNTWDYSTPADGYAIGAIAVY